MTEPTTTDPVSPATNTKKFALIGAGVALIAGTAVAMNGNRGDVAWSDANQPAKMVGAAVSAPPVAAGMAAPSLPEAPTAIRGVIKAVNESTIASRMTARIIAMPYRTGQSFGRGALLARFDCAAISAELAAARASANAYKKTYDTNVELDQYQAIGKNEVAVSGANLGKANAEARAVSAQLNDCAVYAPFAGTVVEQIGHKGEVAASGQALLKIQSGGNLEADVIVPSKWLTWLRPGADFDFKIDETGDTVKGRITRLGASVDPVSKTIRVTGNISGASSLVLPGMSGTADFPQASAAPQQRTPDGNPS